MQENKFVLSCPKGHKLFLATYRDSSTMKRIKDLHYCPDCDVFFKITSKKFQVKVETV